MAFLLQTKSSLAFNLKYGKVIDNSNSHVVIKYVGIEKSDRYLCSITTMVCVPTNKNMTPQNLKSGKKRIKEIDFFREEDIQTNIFDINSYNTLKNFKYDETNSFYISNTKDDPYNWQLHHADTFRDTDEVVASNVSYVDEIKKVSTGVVFNVLQKDGYGPAVYNVAKKEVEYFKIPNIQNYFSNTIEKVVTIEKNHAVIMEPASIDKEKNYTLVVWLHGGPPRQASFIYHPYLSYGTYDSILQLLQKNNVIVIKLDYRGSFGYGQDYIDSIKGQIGKGDVTDVMDTIKYMRENYGIDKVYLMGNSYGGYLSLKTLVENPNDIAGALSINGVTDWESLMDFYSATPFHEHFNGQPSKDNKDLYQQASIINKIKNLDKQKIKIIQGTNDKTVQPWQADLLYKKLRAKKKNVTLKKYVGQDHVFTSKKVITDLCKQMLNFANVTNLKDCR